MALTNYGDLKTSIANYMHRSDLTSVLGDFITLAEKRIVNDLIDAGGHSALEDSTSLPVTSHEATLPSDLVGIRSIVTEESSPRTIAIVTLDVLKTSYATAGTGRAGTVRGSKLTLSPDASTHNVTLYYFKAPTAMSGASDTNSLFPLMSGAYLYGSLIEASIYTKSSPEVWAGAYQQAITKEATANKQAKWANAMYVRAA